MKISIKLLPHQNKFVTDVKTRFLALSGGYAAGKTYSLAVKGIYMAMLNVGFRGVLCSPTNSMARDSLTPMLRTMLEDNNIPYTYTSSPYPDFIVHFAHGSSQISIRSAENYKRLAGMNLAWFGVDEVDTIERGLAHRTWKMLISRLRSINAPYVQGFAVSTPEGYNFLYDYWVKEPRKTPRLKLKRKLIKASTYDNPYLDEEYIQSMLDSYPANLIEAYLHGNFVNLNTETVYYNFDRKTCATTKTLEDFDDEYEKVAIHIGMDFNVGKCCGIVHVIERDIVYAIDELSGIKNTEYMIKAIKRKFPERRIYVYPDASSDNESTNASRTDLQLLKAAGFSVRARRKNPRIRNRVISVNAMFLTASGQQRYYINIDRCPVYVEALETQAYGTDNKPDKEHDQDHPNDAGGYFIYYKYPIRVNNRKMKLSGF